MEDVHKKKLDAYMYDLLRLHSEIWKTYQNHDVDTCIPLLKELELTEEKYC